MKKDKETKPSNNIRRNVYKPGFTIILTAVYRHVNCSLSSIEVWFVEKVLKYQQGPFLDQLISDQLSSASPVLQTSLICVYFTSKQRVVVTVVTKLYIFMDPESDFSCWNKIKSSRLNY